LFKNLHLNQQPNYPTFIPNVFSEKEINTLLDKIEPLPYHRAVVGEEEKIKDQIRRSNIKWLTEETFQETYFKLFDLIEDVNNQYYGFNLQGAPEMIQYTEYNSNEKGYFNWHLDLGSGKIRYTQRKISVTITLSDPDSYKGGDLDFLIGESPIRSKRGIGSAIIFPSYLLHRVTPVTKGMRKSLVLWVGGCQFK